MNGVVVADYLAINNGAISTDNVAGLALNAVVVDAAQLTNAQRTVCVEATDNQANGIKVSINANSLAGIFTLYQDIRRSFVVNLKLIARLGNKLSKQLMDALVVANRAIALNKLLCSINQILCISFKMSH